MSRFSLAAGLWLALSAGTLTACAPAQLAGPVLAGPVVQVPSFEPRSVRLSSLNLRQNSAGQDLIGEGTAAQIELTVQVRNPNPFPLRLHSLAADLFLTGQPVAALALPDVALPARSETVQTVRASVPVSQDTAAEWLKVARGQGVPYRLDGTFTADLGTLGQPSFGPLTLVQGQWRQPAILPF
ncbi:MAG: LEA type 2 family protein [Deinococcus sp.]|nr:LEA type 2 family protein [Deinococcus sp.]